MNYFKSNDFRIETTTFKESVSRSLQDKGVFIAALTRPFNTCLGGRGWMLSQGCMRLSTFYEKIIRLVERYYQTLVIYFSLSREHTLILLMQSGS